MDRTYVILVACLITVASPLVAQPQFELPIQINECLLGAVEGSVELLPCSLGFNALGEIAFSIKNRGSAGVNTAPVASGSTKTKQVAGPKIKIDIYLQDKLIQSIYHGSLGPGASKQFAVKIPSNYPTPRCSETRALKIVVDPQNQIVEASDANNLLARTADRPCPDMAIDFIKKRSNDLKTEFVAEIRLVNKGNAHARFRYLALTLNSSSFGPLPSADFDKLMELAPGQGKTFTIGNAFGYQKMYVRVFVDRFNEVAELDESNNFKEKTLD